MLNNRRDIVMQSPLNLRPGRFMVQGHRLGRSGTSTANFHCLFGQAKEEERLKTKKEFSFCEVSGRDDHYKPPNKTLHKNLFNSESCWGRKYIRDFLQPRTVPLLCRDTTVYQRTKKKKLDASESSPHHSFP